MPTIYKPKKKRENEGNRKERQKIYNTPLWKGMRKTQVQQQPLCQVCEIEGKVKLAEDVHHLISFVGKSEEEKQQLAFNPDNIISVCRKHHNEIHNGKYKGCKSLEQIKQYWEAHNK